MKTPTLMILTLAGCLAGGTLGAQVADTTAAQAYETIALQRAKKIVATLSLSDSAKAVRVQETIARQYRDLHAIHESRDRKTAAAASEADRTAAELRTSAQAAANEIVRARHAEFISQLAAELTPAQIDQVKDGMTYGVLPLTLRVYQQMLPDLTAEQKQQIVAWLTEAREHAMDAGSAEEKHAWFGKYKGKINNYLSAAGIDMKAAEKNLHGHADVAGK